MREAIGKCMRAPQFDELCLDRLGYTTNPWEVEHVMVSKEAIGEPWVSGKRPVCLGRPIGAKLTEV